MTRGDIVEKQDTMICYCSNVPKSKIVKALDNGAKTLADIQKMTGACTVARCKEMNPSGKCCSPQIMAVIKEYFETK